MKNSFSLPDFTSAAKAQNTSTEGFIAALKALRHPKSSLSACTERLKAAPFQNLIEI
jgi:hypothetical protein